MAVMRDENNKKNWLVTVRYRDWRGKKHVHKKRGFTSKRDAQKYERAYLLKVRQDPDMFFGQFVDTYLADMQPKLKPSTFENKSRIIKKHILPYFEEKKLDAITSSDLLKWQNELLGHRDREGKGYSATYLHTIDNQMHAIFNFAQAYYGLTENPCDKVKKMGKHKGAEMNFWTLDEYKKFIETMITKPISYYAFQLLYWTGIREGELLGLQKGDFDFENKTMGIRRTRNRVGSKTITGTPKTEKSYRTIELPDFLVREIEDYFGMLYEAKEEDFIFPISKSYLHHEMDRGCRQSGVKRIRIHDLRHSHVAHLIELGFSPVAIAQRMGHESARVTLNYAHLYPSKQRQMADVLNAEYGKTEKPEGEQSE